MRKLVMNYQRSRLALVSRRLGVISVFIIVLAILGRHWEYITPKILLDLVIGASIIAIIAGLVAFAAGIRLWYAGGRGFTNAFMGFAYALLTLCLPVGTLIYMRQYPNINDVSTDLATPPSVVTPMGAYHALTLEHAVLQRTHYPDIVPRRFRISPYQLHAAALEVGDELGWALQAELPVDLSVTPSSMGFEVITPVFSFHDYVTIRIQPDKMGSLIDIRSKSGFGSHDLGANAARIRDFWEELDTVLIKSYGIKGEEDLSKSYLQETGDSFMLEPTKNGKGAVNSQPKEEVPLPSLKPSQQ